MFYLKVKKGSPSLKNHLNRGGSFKEWRHNHTNYDFAWKSIGEANYAALVADFIEVVGTLNNKAHKAIVLEWVATKLGD